MMMMVMIVCHFATQQKRKEEQSVNLIGRLSTADEQRNGFQNTITTSTGSRATFLAGVLGCRRGTGRFIS